MANADRSLPPDHVIKAVLKFWGDTQKQQIIPITGRSMLPLIQSGDQVRVAPGMGRVQRGNVIVFMQDNKMVAHRVLHIQKSEATLTFIAKGDNNASLDPPVTADRYVGRVLKINRGGRWISIDTPAWRATGWLIAMSMIAWLKIYDRGRHVKRKFWREKPTPTSTILHHVARWLSSLPLKVIQKITCR